MNTWIYVGIGAVIIVVAAFVYNSLRRKKGKADGSDIYPLW